MYKPLFFATLLGGAVLFTHTVHAGGRGSVPVPAPWIETTLIDSKQSVMKIQGRSFGQATPSVLLGKTPLKVKQSSDLEIVAELPDNLKTASYRLVVVTGSLARTRSEPFFTTILTE